jgi:hypothetical protein
MKKNSFNEQYLIKAKYQKEDGYWTYIEKSQDVEIINGVNEKNNHEKAKEQFLLENKHLKNLSVQSVIYC